MFQPDHFSGSDQGLLLKPRLRGKSEELKREREREREKEKEGKDPLQMQPDRHTDCSENAAQKSKEDK